MLQKIRKTLVKACDVMELLMAFVVVAAVFVSAVSLYPQIQELWSLALTGGETAAFLEFLETVMNVAIGIELVKMLCKPSSENIIEVLIFLIARHMIVQSTTAVEDLLAVVSICILFVFRRIMTVTKTGKDENTAG